MLRILCYTKYTFSGASSRLRFYGYERPFASMGVHLEIHSLLSAEYVSSLQIGKKSFRSLLLGYLKRFGSLLKAHRHADLVWIEKELFPWVPICFERLFLPKNIPVVIDYDDAVFHLYDRSKSPILRVLLGNKHRDLTRIANGVTPGNAYLAQHCAQWGAAAVHLTPTVINLDTYKLPVRPTSYTRPIKVVWIGQRSTTPFLKTIEPVLRMLTYEGLINLVVIGGTADLFDFPFDSGLWSEETEVFSIQSCQIGIMPLTDGPFERGKCGYKLVQYMACALPVVASPVGVNAQIVEHGSNGFLATNLDEWESSIRKLAGSAEMRYSLGMAGRRKIQEAYSVQSVAPQVAAFFRQVSCDFKNKMRSV